MKVLKGIATLRPEDVVRGQFRGYRSEPGVNPMSSVETYVALKLSINSWRWKGVPFYIRAGKCMATTSTEVVVRLRQAPAVFTPEPPPANCFRFQVTPTQTIAITSFVKLPGDTLRGESRQSEDQRARGPARGRCVRGASDGRAQRRRHSIRPTGLRRRLMAHRRSDPRRCDAGVPGTSREAGDPSRRVASRHTEAGSTSSGRSKWLPRRRGV